jgi:hypothetical protein
VNAAGAVTTTKSGRSSLMKWVRARPARKEIPMTFALWMLISNAANGAVHISNYKSLEECKKAAIAATYVGPPGGSQTYSFICIENGSNL